MPGDPRSPFCPETSLGSPSLPDYQYLQENRAVQGYRILHKRMTMTMTIQFKTDT